MNFSFTRLQILRLLLISVPLGLFVIQSWTSFIFALTFLVTTFLVLKNHRTYLLGRGSFIWVVSLLLTLPFFAELAAHIIRGEIIYRDLDGPFRFLMASMIFLCLSRHQDLEGINYFYKGMAWSLYVTLAYIFVCLLFWPDSLTTKWGGRLAMYFGDPLTMSCFLVSFIGAVMFSEKIASFKNSGAIKVTVILGVFSIVSLAASRTSWIALFVALELWFFSSKSRIAKMKHVVTFHLALALMMTIAYYGLAPIQVRVHETITSIQQIYSGDWNTSLGIRVGLLLLDLELVRMFPVSGIADGSLPNFQTMKAALPFLTELIYQQKILSGSHIEWVAHFVRKGVVGGGLTVFAILLFPFWFIINRARNGAAKALVLPAIWYLIVIFVSGFGIQVFNLKMFASIHALFLAVAFSGLIAVKGNRKTLIQY